MHKKSNKKLKSLIGVIFLVLCITPLTLFYFKDNNFGETKNNIETPNKEDKNLLFTSLSERWNDSYSFAGTEIGYNIDIDSNGNVYVGGTFTHPTENYNLGIIKYNSNGQILWNRSFNGPASGSDSGYDITVDSVNNRVYVAGYTYDNPYWNMTLVQYTTDGVYKWNQTWSSSNGDSSFGKRVAVNQTGYVFIAGKTGDKQVSIACYDVNGTNVEKTSIDFDTEFQFSDMVIDNESNIYITGYNYTETPSEFINKYNTVIGKYDCYLNEKWLSFYSNDEFNITKSRALALDNSNNIYISGQLGKEYSFDTTYWHIIKYDNEGNFLNNYTFFQGIFNEQDNPEDIVIDKATNSIYLIGTVNGTNHALDTDVMIAKFNHDVKYLFNWTWDGGDWDNGYGLYLNQEGKIFACGKRDVDLRTDPIYQDYDLLIISYELRPESFSLAEVNHSPGPYDEDGVIILNWSVNAPIDAINYTVYNYSSYISEINSSLNKNAEGITDTNFTVGDLPDGTYYYIIQAFNEYGNSSSNCQEVTIGRTPGTFTVGENSTKPYDSDGIFWLNWTNSPHAETYSIYYDSSEIANYGDAILYEKYISSNQYKINLSTLGNVNWYFTIVANNTFEDGYAENQAINNVNVSIGISPTPFTLLSQDADVPDLDGLFTLNWTESTYADNYSLYWSLEEISDVSNPNVSLLYNGTKLSYYVDELLGPYDDIYYFKTISENQFGTNESNCFNVTVGYPGLSPTSFSLSSEDAGEPDIDGLFTLNWTESTYGDNYSLYWSLEEISDVSNPNVPLLYKGPRLSYYIEERIGEDDMIYYFTVISQNQFGTNKSNCFNVTVGYPGVLPAAFTLDSSDAGDPDQDGQFTLTWSASTYADNYSLYISTSEITNVNDSSVQLLYNGTETTYEITEAEGLSDDVYYFKVIAENQFGNNESNTFSITVGNPSGGGTEPFPWWLQAILTGIISATAGLVIKISYSRYKKRKELLEKISEQLDKVDDIEKFLKDKLGFEEWQKLQEPLNQYQKQAIDQKDLIKRAKKELGDQFMELFKS
ncbi:MAG: hypothetical protein EU548_01810 [Promethearchaeota archaeon]|nr:MAG: hypothetical protein EU548_01810 [Candidatus Lokiarchaeota archaeon]